MKFTFSFTLLFACIYCTYGKTYIVDHFLTSDSALQAVLDNYKNAFNEKDTTYLDAWVIKQYEYDAIVRTLKISKISCLKESDVNYSVRTVYDGFREAASKNIKLDSIAYFKFTDIQGCGGVMVKKIDAKVYFKNKSVEMPFSLLFIRDFSMQYKLLDQIVNTKLLRLE